MSTICHRRYCRSVERHSHWCRCSGLTTGGLHERFHFNKWFISHIRYTAEFIYQLLMPDAQRTVKRILPPSAVTSVSADPEEPTDTRSVSSYSSEQQTSETHETDLDQLHNDLYDFINDLHFPSTPDASVSSVNDYNFLSRSAVL